MKYEREAEVHSEREDRVYLLKEGRAMLLEAPEEKGEEDGDAQDDPEGHIR